MSSNNSNLQSVGSSNPSKDVSQPTIEEGVTQAANTNPSHVPLDIRNQPSGSFDPSITQLGTSPSRSQLQKGLGEQLTAFVKSFSPLPTDPQESPLLNHSSPIAPTQQFSLDFSSNDPKGDSSRQIQASKSAHSIVGNRTNSNIPTSVGGKSSPTLSNSASTSDIVAPLPSGIQNRRFNPDQLNFSAGASDAIYSQSPPIRDTSQLTNYEDAHTASTAFTSSSKATPSYFAASAAGASGTRTPIPQQVSKPSLSSTPVTPINGPENAGVTSKLFQTLAYMFSKKEITGSMQVKLITGIKKKSTEKAPRSRRNSLSNSIRHKNQQFKSGENHDQSSSSQQNSLSENDYLSCVFDICRDDLFKLDSIIVTHLGDLFQAARNELQGEYEAGIAQVSEQLSKTSQSSVLTNVRFGDTLNDNMMAAPQQGQVMDINSNMETAIEWVLQARPRGYNYKGIGKWIRELIIVSKAPFDLYLTHIPLFLHFLPQLQSLTMDHHNFSSVPAYLFFFSPDIQRVSLTSCKIKSIFSEVPASQFTGLLPSDPQSSSSSAVPTSTSDQECNDPNRKSNLLEHLSSPLSYFAALKPSTISHLDLSDNLLSSIPPFISNLVHLKYLSLSKNQLTTLPSEMAKLTNLQELFLDNNYINWEIPVIPSVTHLSWSQNSIKPALMTFNPRTVLACISGFCYLSKLNLSFNALDQLPLAVLALRNTLTYLDLSNNYIYQIIGEEIAQMKEIRHLCFANNKIKSIPAECINQLPHLSHLDISENLLVELPIPLNPLARTLQVLNLSKNQLKRIPMQSKLDASNLEGIFVKDTDIQQFECLTKVDLSSNKIVDLPELFFESCGHSLISLNLSHNELTQLPSSSSQLTSLTYLDLSYNKLTNSTTLAKMRQLKYLDLNDNDDLTELPRTFSEVNQLSTLLIANTKLTRSAQWTQSKYGDSDNTSSPHTPRSSVSSTSSNKYSLPNQPHLNWIYMVTPLKPATDKAWIERVPQLLSLARSTSHPLLLRALCYLCKLIEHHDAIIDSQLIFTLLTAAKLSPKPTTYEDSLHLAQSQIGALVAMRFLAKNQSIHDRISGERSLVSVLSEHVNKAASEMDHTISDHSIYDGGKPLPKSASEIDFQTLSEENGTEGEFEEKLIRMEEIQLARLHNKIQNGMAGLSLDILCYLSFHPALRDLINEVPALVESVKKLSKHVEPEMSERAKRTLAGIGVAPDFIPSNRGVRILTLDGGGTRGFTAVLMLKRIEEISGRRLSELFDMMVGSSTGALIATLSSWTGLTMPEAVTYYREACGIIFAPRGSGVLDSKYTAPIDEAPKPNTVRGSVYSLHYSPEEDSFLKVSAAIPRKVKQHVKDALSASASTVPLLDPSSYSPSVINGSQYDKPNGEPGGATSPSDGVDMAHPAGISASGWYGLSPWARVGGFFSMLSTRSFYDTEPLERVLQNLGDPQATMLDTAANGSLRLIYTAMEIGVNPPQPYLLRNFSYKKDKQSKFSGTSALKMWESMRATTAAPAYFDSFFIGGRRLVDGGIYANNPSAVAFQEARALWPEKPVDVVLSVGVGIKSPAPVPPSIGATFAAIVDSATETEQTHGIMQSMMPKGTYFRLQPVDDVYDFPLDETKQERLDAVLAKITKWLEDNDDYLHEVVEALMANRVFDDEAQGEGLLHHSKSSFFRGSSSGQWDSDTEDEIAPSPLRPIPSTTSIMDKYSPLDDLQEWDEEE